MKRRAFLLTILIFLQILSYGQSTIYHSWDGKDIANNSKLMTLNIFVNVIYDEHPDTNKVDTTFWPEVTDTLKEGVNVLSSIPSYLLDFMDTVYVCGNTHGCMTRVYGESSFDSLQITGDFIVVNVRESRVLNTYPQFKYDYIAKAAVDVINKCGFSTLYGHNSIDHYDYKGNNQFYFTQFLIRNISKAYGNLGQGSGYNNCYLGNIHITINNVNYGFSGKHTLQNIGGYDISKNPTSIVTHEISHSLYGSNDFHTSGGNHRGPGCTMPWMGIQGGYGLMGAAGASLVSCNGYERWRMHWKHPSAPYYICARDFANIGFSNSDIAKEDGNKWFTLRDFVTYGDAVRIKLPYKDSTITPNQYIWLEFHNVGNNDKLDFLQFTPTDTCLYQGASGIYAYYQIGRDVLESENENDIWDIINRDNLRVISNEGFWDYGQYLLPDYTDFVCTRWGWTNLYYMPEYSNAFSGYQDQETFIIPRWYDMDLGDTKDSIFDEFGQFLRTDPVIREFYPHNMIKNGDTVTHNIIFNGDALDAFSTHRKLNMGTNPSTCNAKTCYTSNNVAQTKLTFETNAEYNNTTTYLTGLSIEMIPVSTGDRWRVHIRWDDYDIADNARWTGKIVLKGTEQVNLTRGYSITLAQNRTPAQQTRNIESGYFAEPTKLTCEAGSIFTQQPQTTLILTEKSRFVMDSGATYHLGDSAQIVVQGKSTFTITRGADFTGGIASEIIVDSLSTLYVYDTAKLRREARIIVRPGGKLIVNGGTLTSACDGEMWQGIVVEGDSTQRQIASKQGAVYLTNATIENARDAIFTRGATPYTLFTKSGGIVQANNTLFYNNCRSVKFLPYENHTIVGAVASNVGQFTRCTFLVDDDNLFSDNYDYFECHASLYGVRGIKFNGCTFRNGITFSYGMARGRAIYTEDAGFLAKRVCPALDGPQDPCYCAGTATDTVTRCSYEGFYQAVYSCITDGADRDITIDNCDFVRNHTGVTLSVADNARVSFCDFDLSDSVSYCGVELGNTTGYTVESNVFHGKTLNSTCFGVRVNNSGTADNVIRKNVFSALNKACYASGLNGGMAGGLHFECNTFNNGIYDIYGNNVTLKKYHGSSAAGEDNTFSRTMTSSLYLTSDSKSIEYWYSSASGHIPYNPSSNVTLHNRARANACSSSLCGGYIPLEPRGETALTQYQAMAEELSSLIAEYVGRGYSEEDAADNAEAAALVGQMSDLSAEMGDLSRAAIRTILSDSVVDMALLKEWYRAIVETMCTSSLQEPGQTTPVPVAAYQLSEVYSTERDWTAAREVLASIPVRFVMDSVDADEYRNYLALQQLRENVEGNWYRQSQPEIAELQGVAEHNAGRAARMAKEILCFFHHICYEDEPLMELEGIGERNARGGVVHRAATTAITTGTGTLTLYPNPAHNTLTVESTSPIREITVYDMAGHAVMVRANNYSPQQRDLNTSSLHAGIYLLNVVTDNGTETAKFVKN